MNNFKLGDCVVVSNPDLKTYGMTGIVATDGSNYWFTKQSSSAYIKLEDGKTLYYNLKNLKKSNECDTKENSTMYITGDFKVAKVKFISGTNTNAEYEYAMFDDYLVGSTVVVSSANHGLGLAKITAIITKEEAKTKKFEREIVAAVDMNAYEHRKANRARLHELNSQMEKRAQEINKLAVFEMLAEKDDSLKSMLEEYKSLIG